MVTLMPTCHHPLCNIMISIVAPALVWLILAVPSPMALALNEKIITHPIKTIAYPLHPHHLHHLEQHPSKRHPAFLVVLQVINPYVPSFIYCISHDIDFHHSPRFSSMLKVTQSHHLIVLHGLVTMY